MKGSDERLFFEHDLATPFNNLEGAKYLLERLAQDQGGDAAEALEIIGRSSRTLQKMLYWYWEIRKVEESYEPSPPWSARRLHEAACKEIAGNSLPLQEPASRGPIEAVTLSAPENDLVVALIGAGLSFQAASGMEAAWEICAVGGVIRVSFKVEGAASELDPASFFRKAYHPRKEEIRGRFDAGLPYLTAILSKSGGGRELAWSGNETRLEIWLG